MRFRCTLQSYTREELFLSGHFIQWLFNKTQECVSRDRMAEERKCHVPLSHFQFAQPWTEELELGMQTAIGEVCVMLIWGCISAVGTWAAPQSVGIRLVLSPCRPPPVAPVGAELEESTVALVPSGAASGLWPRAVQNVNVALWTLHSQCFSGAAVETAVINQ